MNTSEKKIRDRKKGSVLVEMAFVLPIFLMLVVGIIEFGRVLMFQQVITNAAREGARAGSIYITNDDAINQATAISQAYLTASGVTSDATVLPPSLTTVSGIPAIQVSINYDYNSFLIGFFPGLPETLTLNATVVMRREI